MASKFEHRPFTEEEVRYAFYQANSLRYSLKTGSNIVLTEREVKDYMRNHKEFIRAYTRQRIEEAKAERMKCNTPMLNVL